MSAQNPTHHAKKALQNFNWDFTELTKDSLHTVKTASTWLLPQLMSFLGTVIQPQWVDHKISSTRTFQVLGSRLDNGEIVFENGRVLHKQELGLMLKLCTYPHASHLYAERQTSEFGSRYNAAVPLVLSALRQYQDVAYNSWDYDDPNIQHFLTPQLYEMTQATRVAHNFSVDTLLAILGSGDPTKYAHCRVVNGSKLDPDFYMLPKLAKLQLTQTCIYHTTHRHKLALGLGFAPDTLAAPLVSTDVLKKSSSNSFNPQLLPWQ